MIRTAIAALAGLLLVTGTCAWAETDVSPSGRGEFYCPAQWLVDGTHDCQPPPGAGLIALPEAGDKARTQRLRAIDARDHGAQPYSDTDIDAMIKAPFLHLQ